MPRTSRRVSSADIYHVIIRGSGKQIIFEDDEDRLLFLKLVDRYLKELGGTVFAWALMSDHVHVVIRLPLERIATLMKKLGASYFANFNKKTGRSGKVLQGRFFSEAINTDEYLMTCVRYVHQNPEKAGICSMEECAWSSYRDYAGESLCHSPLETESEFVLGVFGGLEGFMGFHAGRNYAVPCIDVGKTHSRMTDDEALIYAKSLVGEYEFQHIREFEKPKRNSILRQLKENRLSLRQIGRLPVLARTSSETHNTKGTYPFVSTQRGTSLLCYICTREKAEKRLTSAIMVSSA